MEIVDVKDVSVTHEKLQNSLQNFMRIMGNRGYFKYSESLNKRIENMKLILQEEGTSCYTNFKAVFIGLMFEYIKTCKTLDEKYRLIRIIIAHEVAHLRFTNQKTWNAYCHSSHGKYKKLLRYAIDMLNAIEDGRIEYHMSKVSPKVKKGFKYLRRLMAKDIQEGFDKIDKTKKMGVSKKLTHFFNGVLYIVCTLKLPDVPNDEVMEYLRKVLPLIVYSRRTKSTQKAVDVTEKVLEIIEPLRTEYDKKVEEKMEGKYDVKSSGSDTPMEESDIDEMDEVLEPEEVDSELPEEVRELLDEMADKVEEMLTEESEPPPSSSLYDVDEDEEDKSDDKKLDDYETSLDKDEENEDGGFDGEETEETTVPSSDTDTDTDTDDVGSATGGDDTDISETEKDKRSLDEIMEDFEGVYDEHEDEIKEKIEEEMKQMEKEFEEPITFDILNDYLLSDKKSSKKDRMEKKEEEKINELSPSIDEKMHADCEAFFKAKKEQQKFTPFEYYSLAKPILPLSKKASRELKTLSDYQLESTLRFQRRGHLDRRGIVNIAAHKDPKSFKRKQIDITQLTMDVVLLVDGSGSKISYMHNPKNDVRMQRFQMDRIVAMFLHETLKKANFPHAIWWFDEKFGTKQQRFASMVDFGNCFHKDASLYLKDISAYENNRDGFSIGYAGEYLHKRGTSHKKLLIVLSDGLPEANDYSGPNANEDVKRTIQDLERKGIKTIGIFTGSEDENPEFKEMYKNHLFVNNENFFDLPSELKQILVREFKEHLNSLGN